MATLTPIVAGLGCVALLSLVAGAASAQADEARAAQISAEVCAVCHGARGESSSEVFPRLAGQHWEYIAKQLANFKSGKRKGTAMNDMAVKLAPDEMAALGRHFEKMSVPPMPVKDPDLAAVGKYIYHQGNPSSRVPACIACHGEEGLGSAALPRLAGQHASYLETQLRDFGKRVRTNDNSIMQSTARKLTELEMKAVAEYLSGK